MQIYDMILIHFEILESKSILQTCPLAGQDLTSNNEKSINSMAISLKQWLKKHLNS